MDLVFLGKGVGKHTRTPGAKTMVNASLLCTDKEDRSNSSQVRFDRHGPMDELALYIAVSLMVLIIVTGSIGNIMVIIAVKTTRILKITSNIFVVNLSICDLTFVIGVLPFNIYTYINDGWYLGDELCLFVGFLGYTLTGTTIITITLIAFNRYKLVIDIGAYRSIFTTRKIVLMLVAAWCVPIVCLIPALTGVWGKFSYVPVLVTCNLVLDHQSQLFKLFLLVIRAGVPCTLIMYYYFMIFHTTRSSHRRLVKQCLMSSLDRRNHKKEMHLTRMMIAIFIAFIISYFPCTITGMIDWDTILSKQFHMFCAIAVYIGSAVNPFIYGLMNRQFRKAYLRILCCKGDTSNYKMVIKNQPIRNPYERNLSGLDSLDSPQYWIQGPGSSSVTYENPVIRETEELAMIHMFQPIPGSYIPNGKTTYSPSSTEVSLLEHVATSEKSRFRYPNVQQTIPKLEFKPSNDINVSCDWDSSDSRMKAEFYLDSAEGTVI